MNLETAKQNTSLLYLASEAGLEPKRQKGSEYLCRCPNPNHADVHPSCNINANENVFICRSCGVKGDVIEWIKLVHGCDFKEAAAMLGMDEFDEKTQTKPKLATKPVVSKKPVVLPDKPTFIHDYTDIHGKLRHRVYRYDIEDGKKQFRQRGIDENGNETDSMDGIQRFPYRYRFFPSTETLFFVEGEKCADFVAEKLGLPSTCTCGGAGGWKASYANYFDGKELVLIPDNDKVGREYMLQIAKDCSESSTIRILDLYAGRPFKWDVVNEVEKHHAGNPKEYADKLVSLAKQAPRFVSGVELHIYSAEQLKEHYKQHVARWSGCELDISVFIPAASRYCMTPLIGGDLLVVGAQTGGGKTAFISNLEMAYPKQNILHFSIELDGPKMYERNQACAHEMLPAKIKEATLVGLDIPTDEWKHVYTVPLSRINTDVVGKYISRADLIMGEKPRLVVIDYLQLMKSCESDKSRYEKFSNIIEELKRQAKEYDVIMTVLTQLGRGSDVNLFSAKETGSIENSCSMMLLLDDDKYDQNMKIIKCEKNSGGESAWEVRMKMIKQYYRFKP